MSNQLSKIANNQLSHTPLHLGTLVSKLGQNKFINESLFCKNLILQLIH